MGRTLNRLHPLRHCKRVVRKFRNLACGDAQVIQAGTQHLYGQRPRGARSIGWEENAEIMIARLPLLP